MSDEDGFSLVEVMVAALVLAVGAAAVATILVAALNLSRGNGQRVQASALMTAEVEAARGQAVDTLPVGSTSSEVTQQNTRYTVRRDVAWLTSGAGADACTSASARTVTKTVTVTVTWPGMGTTAPVSGDTQLSATPTSAVLATIPGAVGVVVRGADGAGVADVQVALVGPSPSTTTRTATTGAAGCASFPDVVAGSYEARASRTGYVAPTQSATGTTGSFTVLAGRVARPRAVLDKAGSIKVTTTAASGTQRVGVPLTLDAPFATPTTRRTYAACSLLPSGSVGCLTENTAGTEHTAASLFPGAYRVAGCSTTSSGVSTSLAPGGTGGATLVLATASLRGASGSTLPPSTVYARPASTSACAGAPALTLSTAGGAGNREVPLPDGPWEFSRYPAFSTSNTVTLVQGSSTTVLVPA